MKMVLVEWIDATRRNPGWFTIKTAALPERVDMLCRTVGWVVKDRPLGLTLTNTLTDEHTDAPQGVDTITIPRGCIKRVRRIT